MSAWHWFLLLEFYKGFTSGRAKTNETIQEIVIIFCTRFVVLYTVRGWTIARKRSKLKQMMDEEVEKNAKAFKKFASLHNKFPPFHCTLNLQAISTGMTEKITNKSAIAKLQICSFTRDRRDNGSSHNSFPIVTKLYKFPDAPKMNITMYATIQIRFTLSISVLKMPISAPSPFNKNVFVSSKFVVFSARFWNGLFVVSIVLQWLRLFLCLNLDFKEKANSKYACSAWVLTKIENLYSKRFSQLTGSHCSSIFCTIRALIGLTPTKCRVKNYPPSTRERL